MLKLAKEKKIAEESILDENLKIIEELTDYLNSAHLRWKVTVIFIKKLEI